MDVTPEQIEKLVAHLRRNVSFSNHVGLRIEEVEPGRTLFAIDIDAVHMNGAGAVHGGVHATLADSAMAVALIAEGLKVSTTQLTINYVAPLTEGRITCRAEVVHRGRRNALTEAKLYDESGRLIALATAAFRVFEPRPPSPALTATTHRENEDE